MAERRGEFELIESIRERLLAGGAPRESEHVAIGSGDDAAVVSRDGASVVSVDACVEGVHFRMPPFEPPDAGHKALAAALSDLAAMGAAPGEAYVQLGLPPELGDERALGLAEGMAELAAGHGVVVAGGDITASPVLFLGVTVVGHAASPAELVSRAGARAADLLAVTGALGGAAAGLALLDDPGLADPVDPQAAAALRLRQLRPQPRLAEGRALAAAGATAMVDLSDGLAGDLAHLARASGLAAEVDADALPIQQGVAEVAGAKGAEALDLVVGGGEDYELLAAIPERAVEPARAALSELGTPLTVVGELADGAGVELRSSGAWVPPTAGFDQRRSR